MLSLSTPGRQPAAVSSPFFLALFVALLLLPASAAASPAGEVADRPISAYILKEVGGRSPFLSKATGRVVRPASLTKILTCIMAIESGKLDQEVLITREATRVERTKAGFRPGERFKLIDLVKAAMVNSSNDAAFAIAIHLSGSVPSFVKAMNYRARMMGMRNSTFTNPAGFDTGRYAGNFSTAEDLMALTEYAIRNPLFNEISQLETVRVRDRYSGRYYLLGTHNKLLLRYAHAVGIKTGYTRGAGKCLIARAQKDGRDMLLVMLDAQGDRWSMAEEMFESAFASEPTAFLRYADGVEMGPGTWERRSGMQ